MVRNRIGSMAFESRDDYAKVVHDHDDIYSRLDIGWHAVLPVSASYKLMTVHLSNFLEDGTVVDNTFDIVGPSAIIEYDTAEDIGTLRFTGVPKLDSGKIVKYGTKYNIDIMDPDFDGWVYPNGTTFSVTPGEFRDACEVYGDDDSFTVPNLESFIKANPGTMTEQAMSFRRFSNGLPKHSHKARNLKVEVTPSRP